MSNDLEAKGRKSARIERTVERTVERKTLRVRPGGDVHADRLSVPQHLKDAYPDMFFFWENDEKGQVQQREARGWEVVRGSMIDGKWQSGERNSNLGSVVSMPVGQGETTDSLTSVLMMLPLEWYEDDLKQQEDKNRQIRQSLRRGSNNQDVNPDGTYAPRLPNGQVGFSENFGSK